MRSPSHSPPPKKKQAEREQEATGAAGQEPWTVSALVHSHAFFAATWVGGSISLAAVGVSLLLAPTALFVAAAVVTGVCAQFIPPGLHF